MQNRIHNGENSSMDFQHYMSQSFREGKEEKAVEA